MIERSDVLKLKRRRGFGAKGEAESVVAVQAASLNAILPTIAVVRRAGACPVGRVRPATLEALDERLELILGLP